MPLMIAEVYDALKEAGASEEKARAAAEAVARHETRLGEIRAELVAMRSAINTVRALSAVNTALFLVVIARLFTAP